MFREMRRKNQQLAHDACVRLLQAGSSGVLSLLGDGSYPYGVPISYVYDDDRLYFHCAASGHKLDAVRSCDKASFCLITQDDVLPEKFTTLYRSVIAFGRIHIMEPGPALQRAIELLGRKYSPQAAEEALRAEIDSTRNRLVMLELTIEHMTGKQSRELL